MPMSLRSRLNDLASSFALGVLDAIRGSSLQELVATSSGAARGAAPPRARAPAAAAQPRGSAPVSRPASNPAVGPARRRGGRLPRRSAHDIAHVIEQVVDLLRGHPAGLRAEQIRIELGLNAKELPRPLKEGLDSGRFAKSGQKRATTYFSKGAGPAKGVGRAPKGARGPAAAAGAKAGGKGAKPRGRQPAAVVAPPKIEETASAEPVVAPPGA